MKKLIVVNWKMYLTLSQSIVLAKRITKLQITNYKIELVLCPSFVALEEVAKVLRGTRIKLGAQDVEPARSGAYTGEVGLDDLTALHVQYVLVGHSERRKMGETDTIVNKKLRAVLKAGMKPILCVGELSRSPTTPSPSSGRRGNLVAQRYVAKQLRAGLQGVAKKDLQRVIVAYEPVWAISGFGGDSDTPEHASAMHAYIRSVIGSNKMPILYGGSVNSNNAVAFLRAAQINGALIGKASTDVVEFKKIIRSL